MSNLIVTIIAAAILIGLAFIGLAIGLILTGKTKITRGTCGWDPTKRKRDDSCANTKSCSLCAPQPKPDVKKKTEKAENDDESDT